MNYIDLGFIVISLIIFLVGFCGKAHKKISKLIISIISVVVSYFTAHLLIEVIYSIQINGNTIKGIINELLTNFSSSDIGAKLVPILIPMTHSICCFLVFWLEALVLMIFLDFIYLIISIFIKKSVKKVKAKKTLGIPGLLSGVIRFVVFILPILFISPLIKNISAVEYIVPALEGNAIIESVSEQYNTSFVIDLSGKLFKLSGNHILEYKVEGETKNVYHELENVGNLTKALPLVTSLMEGENPLQALKELPTEDLSTILEILDENKELIIELIPEDAELPIDITNINFKEEAPVIEVFLEIVEFNQEGEMEFKIENIDNTKLANALAQSELLDSILEPGMLSEIPAENKTAIISEFDSKLINNEISQEEYNKLVAYFN